MVDTFEKFTFTCLKYYGLDPCNYFSAPGLSWDAMLKMTGVTLGKINDPDKYMCFEQGKRGGVILIKDIAKQIMNIAKIMIKKNLKNILFTLI